MIFVTVGTENFPFDRLLKILDEAAGSGAIGKDIFAQTGTSGYRPKNFPSEKMLSFDRMVEQIRRAEIVVAHAGVGSAILSLSLGRIPILFPRRHEFGEHLDNHQVEFAGKMKDTGRLLVAGDARELLDSINNYRLLFRNLVSSPSPGHQGLYDYLKTWLDSV